MTNTKAGKPGERTVRIMWASLAVCLVAAVAAPFFGDGPKAIAVPVLGAVSIAVSIAWLRKKQAQQPRGNNP
ncbi:hypothetical protein [Streptomyces sp. XH2]|uniref:hypothetical protein n=1 Tax=Streptomyces sp. XH2 TaxID=3412483 RepID=UPI003C7B509A